MMAQWQRRLELQPEWGMAQEGEITRQKLAGIVAERLKALAPFTGDLEDIEDKKVDLIEEFEWMAGVEELPADEFDNWMSELYDWGDIQTSGKFFDAKKCCWINTIIRPASAADRAHQYSKEQE